MTRSDPFPFLIPEIKNLCTCTASGNINYQTYDDTSIRFNGECQYKFTEYKNPNPKNRWCNFKVKVINRKNKKKKYDSVSTRAVTFQMRGTYIRLGQKNIRVIKF